MNLQLSDLVGVMGGMVGRSVGKAGKLFCGSDF
jgi:hypothetical protein